MAFGLSKGSAGARRQRLFAPFPETGPWSALGLTRGQFLGILALSVAVFLLWGGALWSHLGGREFGRLAASYAVIPIAVAAALYRNSRLRWPLLLAGSGVIGILKLVATAGLDLLFGLAVGAR